LASVVPDKGPLTRAFGTTSPSEGEVKLSHGSAGSPPPPGETGRRVAPGEGALATASRPVTGAIHIASGTTPTVWQIAEEVPVAIMLNSQSVAVMMATPADLHDFAIGFLIAEGYVHPGTTTGAVLTLPTVDGIAVDVALPDTALTGRDISERATEGRSGCGLCGVREIGEVMRPLPVRADRTPIEPRAVAAAFAALPDHQPMNQENRSVHAAAWCEADGTIILCREDVGRHNALDKLIGAMARASLSPREGFVVMSSRCSFELVQKAASAGIGALATVSAPTALALDLARSSGLALAARARDGVMVFDLGHFGL
jgi:FdhD protein